MDFSGEIAALVSNTGLPTIPKLSALFEGM